MVCGKLGSGRFRLYLDSAKSVLEQCYLDSVSVASSSAVGDQGSREASKEDSLGDEDGGRSSDNTTASSSGIASSGSSRLTVGGKVAERAWSNRAVRIPSAEGKRTSNNNQEDMEEQEQRQRKGARSSRQFRLPRGTDLLRTYQKARARFMPERPRFLGLKHSVVDAAAANIPEGDPDGLGGFGLDPRRRMGRVNHFLAAAPNMSRQRSSAGHRAGFMELGVQESSEYDAYNPSSAGGTSSGAYSPPRTTL